MRYLHLRDQLLELIDGLQPGDPLPSERALERELSASRMTIRRAIDELVTQGRVTRRHGAGTFVSAKFVQTLSATSFSQDMRERGMTPGSRVLGSDTVPAGLAVGRRLGISPRDDVLRVRRLRLADDAPMAIERLYVPAQIVPGLTGEELAGTSFYATLRERFGLIVTDGEQILEATVTDPEESKALSVPEHSPAFLFERVSGDQNGRTVEFVRSVYRGDRYRIRASIRANPWGPSGFNAAQPGTSQRSLP